MNNQVFFSTSQPSAHKLNPVQNAPRHRPGADFKTYLMGKYRGNKPFGGLWTSSHTTDDPDGYLSDWQRGLHTNRLIQAGVPAAHRHLPAWLLTPAPEARVRTITSQEEADEFTREFSLGTTAIREFIGIQNAAVLAITNHLTHWEKASFSYDAIHLTAEGADEIAWHLVHQHTDTAFTTWNCESCLWLRWKFSATQPLP